MIGLGLESAGTEFSPDSDAQNTFATLTDGDSWMIFRNSLTGVLHWDFVSNASTCLSASDQRFQSVLGRFISFPVVDGQ
jgi:hypothetical protein